MKFVDPSGNGHYVRHTARCAKTGSGDLQVTSDLATDTGMTEAEDRQRTRQQKLVDIGEEASPVGIDSTSRAELEVDTFLQELAMGVGGLDTSACK